MSNGTSKSIKPSLNTSKITSFFKPAQRATASRDTDIVNAALSQDHDHPGASTTGDLNLPMRNPKSCGSYPNNSFSDASIPSSSMLNSQTNPHQARVIPSSDGEEDSEDSDGLEDPQKMFGRVRRKNSAADSAVKLKGQPKSPARVAPAAAPKAMAPPSYKFSLDNLVAEKAKSVALDQEILRSRALFEEANKEYTDSNVSNSDKPVSESMLEDAFGEGTAKRLLAALNRKDAWRIDMSWHFYDMNKDHQKPRKNPFPKQALGGGWDAGLASVRNRQQIFLSGFVQDMGKINSLLSEGVYMWMLDELCLEIREDLAYAYFNVLCTLPRRIIEGIVTEQRVSRMFGLLGARDDALNIGKQIVLVKAEMIDDRIGSFYNTKLVTVFLGKVARIISSNSTIVRTSCALLVRLALDVRIAREAEVRSSIEDSLAQLFENVPEERWPEISQQIALNFIGTIPDALYRLRVLNALPVHTPRTHLFRRRLALSYNFDDPSYLAHPYANLVRISRFSDLLMKPKFKIDRNTDYSDLQSLVSIMDIAIDDGPTTGNAGRNDAEVDMLVEDLRNMFSRIHDTNAQNLARTEAKDTIERLVFRLRFAVRIKDKTNLVVETDSGPEWVGGDGKLQSKLPWVGRGRC